MLPESPKRNSAFIPAWATTSLLPSRTKWPSKLAVPIRLAARRLERHARQLLLRHFLISGGTSFNSSGVFCAFSSPAGIPS